MKIQVISYLQESEIVGDGIVNTTFAEPDLFDDYEITVVSFRDSNIWKNKLRSNTTVNRIEDIKTIGNLIQASQKCKVVVVLPEDMVFYYHWSSNKYTRSCRLKDMTYELKNNIMCSIAGDYSFSIEYGRTTTVVSESDLHSDFFFSDSFDANILTKSKMSEVCTSIEYGNVCFTSLAISSYVELMDYLNEINYLPKAEKTIPEWIGKLSMFDDDVQRAVIMQERELIAESEAKIRNAKEKLEKNLEFKSVLYSTGQELVSVVFRMIEEMLGCDLSDFVDERKEDFLIELNGDTFIGEIKGVNSNVRSEHVSQLEVHYQNYIESHPTMEKTLYPLLIIAHQRKTPIDQRKPINDRQIALAERYQSLIIDTYVLLRIYEKYCNKELTREEIVNMIKTNTGCLVI